MTNMMCILFRGYYVDINQLWDPQRVGGGQSGHSVPENRGQGPHLSLPQCCVASCRYGQAVHYCIHTHRHRTQRLHGM